jgi:hypothetical protein
VLQAGKMISIDAVDASLPYCQLLTNLDSQTLSNESQISFTEIKLTSQRENADKGVADYFTIATLKSTQPALTLECHKSTFDTRDAYKGMNLFVSDLVATLGTHATVMSESSN